MNAAYLEYYHQLYVNLTFTKNIIENLKINDQNIFNKKTEFIFEMKYLLFILQICMNCTCLIEINAENDFNDLILEYNYSQVISSIERIEKIKLDMIKLINNN